MSPRNPELPEGTDHIINGAMETGVGTGASTGSSGGSSGGADAGAGGNGGPEVGAGSGFVAGSDAPGDDTGGTAMTTTGGGAEGGGAAGAPVTQQLRDGVQSLKQQAAERARTVADDGKARATSALDDLSRAINEAGDQIDERLGGQYGDYARRAAEAVTGLSDTIRDKDVDELWDDARNVVRKSPGIALGVAAVVGFTLARLVKAGLDDSEDQASNVGNGKRSGGKGA